MLGGLKDLPKPWDDPLNDLLEGVPNVIFWPGFRNDPVLPELTVLPLGVEAGDPLPKLLPAAPVTPRDLAASALRFMIEVAPLLAAGELNEAVRVAVPLNPLVFIVGSTLMT